MIKKSTETIIVQIIGKTCPYTIFFKHSRPFFIPTIPTYSCILVAFYTLVYYFLFAQCREYEKQVGVKRGMITIL